MGAESDLAQSAELAIIDSSEQHTGVEPRPRQWCLRGLPGGRDTGKVSSEPAEFPPSVYDEAQLRDAAAAEAEQYGIDRERELREARMGVWGRLGALEEIDNFRLEKVDFPRLVQFETLHTKRERPPQEQVDAHKRLLVLAVDLAGTSSQVEVTHGESKIIHVFSREDGRLTSFGPRIHLSQEGDNGRETVISSFVPTWVSNDTERWIELMRHREVFGTQGERTGFRVEQVSQGQAEDLSRVIYDSSVTLRQ